MTTNTLYFLFFWFSLLSFFSPLFDKPWFALSVVFFKDIGENQIELFRANL